MNVNKGLDYDMTVQEFCALCELRNEAQERMRNKQPGVISPVDQIVMYGSDQSAFVSAITGVPPPGSRKTGYKLTPKPVVQNPEPVPSEEKLPPEETEENKGDDDEDSFLPVQPRSGISAKSESPSPDDDDGDGDTNSSVILSSGTSSSPTMANSVIKVEPEPSEPEPQEESVFKSVVTVKPEPSVPEPSEPKPQKPEAPEPSTDNPIFKDWNSVFEACGISKAAADGLIQLFESEDMDPSQLDDITHDILRTLGVKMGPAMKIMKLVDQRKKNQ